MPEKDTLADYQKRLKTLTKAEYKDPIKIVEAKKEFDNLKEEILSYKKLLSGFKRPIDEAKHELLPQLAALKVAPRQDYVKLKSLIVGDTEAINDITTLVFGERLGEWSQYALAVINIIGPMLIAQNQTEETQLGFAGRWISFDNASSLPDLWIKKSRNIPTMASRIYYQ